MISIFFKPLFDLHFKHFFFAISFLKLFLRRAEKVASNKKVLIFTGHVRLNNTQITLDR